jgi:hypothetical protein
MTTYVSVVTATPGRCPGGLPGDDPVAAHPCRAPGRPEARGLAMRVPAALSMMGFPADEMGEVPFGRKEPCKVRRAKIPEEIP